MEDMRAKAITELLRSLKTSTEKVIEVLGPEGVSYELIRGQLEALRMEKARMIEENNRMAEENKSAAERAKKIVDLANEEAKKLIEAKRQLFAEAQRRLEEVKQFCQGVDKARLKEHLEAVKA